MIVKFLSSLKQFFAWVAKLVRNPVVRRLISGGLFLASFLFIGRAIVVNWREISQYTWDIDLHFVLFAVLLYPIGMLPAATAWHYLLQALGVRIAFIRNLRIFVFSLLPRHIPGLVWYVSSRSLLYQDNNISSSKIVMATGIENILLVITGSSISLLWFSLTNTVDGRFFYLRIIALIGLFLIVALLVGSPLLNRKLANLQQKWKIDPPIQVSRKEILLSLFWMVVAWAGGGFILLVLSNGFIPIEWSLFLQMIGIWSVAGTVSLSLGVLVQGMGLREIAMVLLLNSLIPLLPAVIISVAFRLVLMSGELLWVAVLSSIMKISTSTLVDDPKSGMFE